MNRKLRPRKCECGCGVKFTPPKPFITWATVECAVKVAAKRLEKKQRKEAKTRQLAEKQDKREHKARVIAAKPLRWFLLKVEKVCHSYIRERDRLEPCISCGRWFDGNWHAGHFNSVGSHPELRFHEDNIHKQCFQCNAMKGGNRAEYEPRLIAKIGQEKVDWLNGPHQAANYTREQLLELEAYYKTKYKILIVERKNTE